MAAEPLLEQAAHLARKRQALCYQVIQHAVANDLVRQAIATVFDGRATGVDVRPIVDWFERGGSVDLSDTDAADRLLGVVAAIPGVDRAVTALGQRPRDTASLQAAYADFVLEGLCALKKISRTDEGRLFASAPAPKARQEARTLESLMDDDDDQCAQDQKNRHPQQINAG